MRASASASSTDTAVVEQADASPAAEGASSPLLPDEIMNGNGLRAHHVRVTCRHNPEQALKIAHRMMRETPELRTEYGDESTLAGSIQAWSNTGKWRGESL